MKVLELFSGTRSIGKAFEARGHEVFSVEWDESLPADLHGGNLPPQEEKRQHGQLGRGERVRPQMRPS